MEGFGAIILATAIAVGLLVLGMSLTLIFKGHHIRSEIADNPEMRKRGIRCAADEMRSLDKECAPGSGCGECSACGAGKSGAE